jgi:hypothetical protein
VAFTWAKLNRGSVCPTLSERDFFTGMGYWIRANPEQCLLATIGKPQRISKAVRQLIADESTAANLMRRMTGSRNWSPVPIYNCSPGIHGAVGRHGVTKLAGSTTAALRSVGCRGLTLATPVSSATCSRKSEQSTQSYGKPLTKANLGSGCIWMLCR